MKTRLFALLLLGTAFAAAPLPVILADDDSTDLSAAPADGSTDGTGTQGKHHGFWRKALAQLDLTDAQKAQIKQIRATVTDRKERRQQVMAVLTDEQKAKLKELVQEYRGQGQSSGGTAATGNAN